MEEIVLVHPDEGGEDGRAGHRRQFPRSAREEDLPPKEGNGQAVEAEVPVALHADELAFAEQLHERERGKAFAIHGHALNAALGAEGGAQPFHRREAVWLEDRVDGEVERAEEEAAHFEVARVGGEEDGAVAFGERRFEPVHAPEGTHLGHDFGGRPLTVEKEIHPGARMLADHAPREAVHLRVRDGMAGHLGHVRLHGLQVFGPQLHERVGDLVGDLMPAPAPREGPRREEEEREERPEDPGVDQLQHLGIALHPVLHGGPLGKEERREHRKAHRTQRIA